MSFASEIKQEVSLKVMKGNDARAELSALVQLSSSISLSAIGMTLVFQSENANVARRIYSLVKDSYTSNIEMFVKKKMNLKKNQIYGVRVLDSVNDILKDVGVYSKRGLREVPLAKIVQTDNNARAYLAGAFLATGSVNSPEKSNYHLEISTNTVEHAKFIAELLSRFNINAKIIERRNNQIVYVKSAEKIADFLRLIEADQGLLDYEDIRIARDFNNQVTRLNNMEVANEMKAMAASKKQLEDIEILKKANRFDSLDEKLKAIAILREENPESSLNELAYEYEKRTGIVVSKSGMKHRFNRIHELALKAK